MPKEGEGLRGNHDYEQESLANLMDNISEISHYGNAMEFHQRQSLDNAQGVSQSKSPTFEE